MGRREFENYGARARQGMSPTELAGRYISQIEAEKRVAADVLKKLEIEPHNRLLEIGCGPGQLLIPLSFAVLEAVGVDHPEVCSVFESRFQSDSLALLRGNFLDIDFEGKTFDRILCYSVLSTLSSTTIEDFVRKILSLLEPGGRLLIGDLANTDKKSRFAQSVSGRRFEELWKKKNLSATNLDATSMPVDRDRTVFTDEKILGLVRFIRETGCDCYLLPQPTSLPWGHTREDLLVIRPD